MAETRAQAMAKEVAAKEVEEIIGSKLEALEAKMDKNIAEMFEAIRIISTKDAASSSEEPFLHRQGTTVNPITPAMSAEGNRATRPGFLDEEDDPDRLLFFRDPPPTGMLRREPPLV